MDGVVVAGPKPKNLQTFKQNSRGMEGGGLKWPACAPLVEDFGNILGRLVLMIIR